LITDRLLPLLKEAIRQFTADNGTLLAASIAFNLLLSVFPLIFLALYIADIATGSSVIQQQISRAIGYLLPVSRQLVSSIITNAAVSQNAISGVALVSLIWGGFSFFNSLRISLNTVWGIRNPIRIYKAHFINLVLMICAAMILIISIMLTAWFNTLFEPGTQMAGTELIRRNPSTRILADIPITGLAFLVFMMLYRFVPAKRPGWKDIWLGALITAVAFEITKIIFIWYIRNFSPYDMVYGSIGTLIAFLMWSYLSALVFLFMAKVTYIISAGKADIASSQQQV
jgi:membrane protein